MFRNSKQNYLYLCENCGNWLEISKVYKRDIICIECGSKMGLRGKVITVNNGKIQKIIMINGIEI
jgi:hypothetical protein